MRVVSNLWTLTEIEWVALNTGGSDESQLNLSTPTELSSLLWSENLVSHGYVCISANM